MNFNQRLLTFFVIFLSMVIESIDAKASTWLEYNNYDITWFSKDQKEFSLNNSKQIAGLAFIVNNQISNFKGCKINLANDIDLGSYDWIPIGSSEFAFEGNFDGNGYKISRIKISKYDSDYIGFFGMIKNNSIKNCIFYICINKFVIHNCKVCIYIYKKHRIILQLHNIKQLDLQKSTHNRGGSKHSFSNTLHLYKYTPNG